jgi:rhomboid protease GluP
MFGPLIAGGEYWRLFTAMFLHAGLAHLVMNGLGLFIVGRLVETSFGHVRFLLIYLLAGLFGSVASFGFNTVAVGAGASGSIFGTLGALAALFAVNRDSFGKEGKQSLVGVLMVAGLVLASGIQTEEVDNWAHLGGFVAGFFIGLVISPRYRLVELGAQHALVDTTSLAKRWWAMPVAAVLLFLGTWVAVARLPEPAYPHTALAESYYRDGDNAQALTEADEAISLEGTAARAYYIRALIRLDQGNLSAAVSDLTDAIHYSGFNDASTRSEAIRLLVSIGARR